MIDDVARWLSDVVGSAGYPGVTLVVTIETLVPPIAGPILPLIGVSASHTGMSLPLTIAAATLGSMIGAWVTYGVSALIGPDRVGQFILRHRRWLRIDAPDLAKAEMWFDTHSDRAVLFGRCIPVVRSLVSLPAGFRRMPFARFTLLTAIGCTAWNTMLILLGASMEPSLRQLNRLTGTVQLVLLVVVVLATPLAVWQRRRRRSRVSASDGRQRGEPDR